MFSPIFSRHIHSLVALQHCIQQHFSFIRSSPLSSSFYYLCSSQAARSAHTVAPQESSHLLAYQPPTQGQPPEGQLPQPLVLWEVYVELMSPHLMLLKVTEVVASVAAI